MAEATLKGTDAGGLAKAMLKGTDAVLERARGDC
jgi:hypothetical protein